ncbi:Uncharacterised protein [Serratia grimesii]|uniref:hypothetical protein n=1 Tax=Serratia grimesii TaxID=82995 RepID=UPI00076F3BA7|nr:hypothetical protein [Serratia grimesii]CUW11439.1 Uncharacterised protein [Serratia grimesii]SMZ56144.1 Uncharacterised protein [Serratia grimesii]
MVIKIKRYNPDFSLSISHELAYMRETPEGGYVAHGDYATLFSELELVKADRDAQQKRADALAVENAALKEMNSSLCSELQEYESDNDDFGPAPQSVVNCFALLTPNTDAALAAIEARGVESLAAYLWKRSNELVAEGGKKSEVINIRVSAKMAEMFSAELREAK